MVAHMMKTANPASLIGIKPVSSRAGLTVVRPLIDCSKAEIEHFVREHAVAYLEDSSNQSDVYLRNRIRRQIVPLMKAERPNVIYHARGLSDNLNDDENYFKEQVRQLLKQVTKTQTGYQLDFSWFQSLHPSLKRRLVHQLIPSISQRSYHDLIQWLGTNPPTGSLDVGANMVVKKVYQNLLIEQQRLMKVMIMRWRLGRKFHFQMGGRVIWLKVGIYIKSPP